MGTKQIIQLAAIVAIAVLMFEPPVACEPIIQAGQVIQEDEVLTARVDGNGDSEEHFPNIKVHSHTESQRVWGTAESGSEDDDDPNWGSDPRNEVDDRSTADDESNTSAGSWGLTDPDSPESTKHAHKPKEMDETVKETRAWGAASEYISVDVETRDETTYVEESDIADAPLREKSGAERKVQKNRTMGVDHKDQKDSKRGWGAGSSEHDNFLGAPTSDIPFVATKHLHHHNHSPPEGYSLAARVYIDTKDKLAHFDYTEGQRITFPYWDCGAAGSTTSPIPLKNAYFRHSLATPTTWSSSDSSDALNPVLVVALSPYIMELNSGETLEFRVGDVVLLEDCLRPGHRMRPLRSGGPNNLRALFLTLPQQHYHIGKQHFSLKKAVMRSQAPCEVRQVEDDLRELESFVGIVPPKTTKMIAPDISSMVQQPFQPEFWDGRRIRMLVLGTIGLSLSTLAADFLGKTAPLWLAVGIGGTCFVAGSTYSITMAGDYILTQLQLWIERSRLESNQNNVKNKKNPDEDVVVPVEENEGQTF
jgi:hypothetical protein